MTTAHLLRTGTIFLLTGALGVLAGGCASRPAQLRAPATPVLDWTQVALHLDTSRVIDASRRRVIPLATYTLASPVATRRLKVALLNHAYHGKNTEYAFVAKNLVAHGYYVVSLQQELPDDEPLPTTGIPTVVRRPNWERGVQNMLFVLQELKRTQPGLNYQHLLLMGHSNGGDMVMLFAQQYPRLVERVISFDNRRMPLPRTRRPRVLSLRSSDQPADLGVLPTPAEQAKYGTTIVPLPATIHNDMWDGATPAQQHEMNTLISKFLAY